MVQTYTLEELAYAPRFLSLDMVQKANSGHPGLPLGMADVITLLFRDFLNFHPMDPLWSRRDRFILSAGHGSALLYSMLYLCGYEHYTKDQLKGFRCLGSNTHGHPEYNEWGIETTTGPLGQGLATAVGIAYAETLSRVDIPLHKTYVLVSDGDLMEGISHEAISFAGHHKLSQLIVLYDNNSITIDGPINLSCSDDVRKRFEAVGWVVNEIDGHNEDEIHASLKRAQKSDRPVLISCRTRIGKGSCFEGSSKSHGTPLPLEEINRMKKEVMWPLEPFSVPEIILGHFRSFFKRCEPLYKLCSEPGEPPSLPLDEVHRVLEAKRILWNEECPERATRQLSHEVLCDLIPICGSLVGGSADLTPSNNTKTHHKAPYVHYGIREHAMGAIMNGLALYQKKGEEQAFIPYGGTFLVFSDYMRPSLRLACLMKLRVIYIFTHDSIGVGEDGPTHQPIEHLTSLRAMPNLTVLRPCDGVEVCDAFEIALQSTGPVAIILSRQPIPTESRTFLRNNSIKGAYIIESSSLKEELLITLLATGSEVSLARSVKKDLEAKHNLPTRVVSIPSFELFNQQDQEYRDELLNSSPYLVGIEAGSSLCWNQYLGPLNNTSGKTFFCGLDNFGRSGTMSDLFDHFGLTKEHIVRKIINKILQKKV